MLKRFFIQCSGSDSKILSDCSIGEQNKHVGIGATIFFTAVMAFIASFYALYTVFDNVWIALGFGFVWGLLIFNLDRFIVSTIKKRDNLWKELLQASPRIVLAIIIAIVISKPLELKIFEKEINQVLLEQKNTLTKANQDQIQEQFSPEINGLSNEIKHLQQQIDSKETEVNNLYETYILEAEGKKGTMLLGKGPVYKEKREKHDALLAELQQLKIDNKAKIQQKEATITALKEDYKNQVVDSQPIIDNYDGLMARIAALDQLPWLPSFFIFILFLAIETSPILAKLLSPKGEYDLKIEDHEVALKTWVEQRIGERKILIKADVEISKNVYDDLTEEEELYRYKRKKAIELMKTQTDSFF